VGKEEEQSGLNNRSSNPACGGKKEKRRGKAKNVLKRVLRKGYQIRRKTERESVSDQKGGKGEGKKSRFRQAVGCFGEGSELSVEAEVPSDEGDKKGRAGGDVS